MTGFVCIENPPLDKALTFEERDYFKSKPVERQGRKARRD